MPRVWFLVLTLAIAFAHSTAKAEVDQQGYGISFTQVKGATMEEQNDRTEWPELVGQSKDAAKTFLEQNTDKQIFLVPIDAMVTMDWSESRVRVRFDPETDKVVQVPRVG